MRNSGKITIHKRHDTVSPQLHFNICKETEVKLDKEHWCQHVPESVQTSREGKVNVLWSEQVQADKTILNNKRDTIIRDNEKETCMLIDVVISGDRNVIKEETEEIQKHEDFTTEMWNEKTKMIPAIIGATRTISK